MIVAPFSSHSFIRKEIRSARARTSRSTVISSNRRTWSEMSAIIHVRKEPGYNYAEFPDSCFHILYDERYPSRVEFVLVIVTIQFKSEK